MAGMRARRAWVLGLSMRVKIQAGGVKRERGDFPLPGGLGKSKSCFEVKIANETRFCYRVSILAVFGTKHARFPHLLTNYEF